MPFNNKLCILFIDLFSDLFKLCCDEDIATKTENISFAHPRPDQHVHIEIETSNNGADRSAQSNSQTKK